MKKKSKSWKCCERYYANSCVYIYYAVSNTLASYKTMETYCFNCKKTTAIKNSIVNRTKQNWLIFGSKRAVFGNIH